MTRAWRAVALLLCLGALLGGCGKKGPPVAPERRLPAAPAEPRGLVDVDAVILTWANPRTRADGTALRDLTLVRVHRREEAEGAPLKPALLARGQVVGYDEVAAIRLAAPAPAAVEGGQVTWADRRGLGWGRRYVYVLTAEDSLGRSSPPSERLAVVFLPAPQAPAGLAAEPGDRQARLTWRAPGALLDGSPAPADELRYRVLRGAAGGPLQPLPGEPAAATTYTDTGLDNDAEYRWAVRALRVGPRGTAVGPASAEVAAVPADTTPPSAPTGLVAIPSPGAVRLAWNPSPEADVALYAIYRAEGPGPLLRVGSTPAVGTVWTDRDVRAGATYRYAVTALDRARRPNESPRSSEVAVTVP